MISNPRSTWFSPPGFYCNIIFSRTLLATSGIYPLHLPRPPMGAILLLESLWSDATLNEITYTDVWACDVCEELPWCLSHATTFIPSSTHCNTLLCQIVGTTGSQRWDNYWTLKSVAREYHWIPFTASCCGNMTPWRAFTKRNRPFWPRNDRGLWLVRCRNGRSSECRHHRASHLYQVFETLCGGTKSGYLSPSFFAHPYTLPVEI